MSFEVEATELLPPSATFPTTNPNVRQLSRPQSPESFRRRHSRHNTRARALATQRDTSDLVWAPASPQPHTSTREYQHHIIAKAVLKIAAPEHLIATRKAAPRRPRPRSGSTMRTKAVLKIDSAELYRKPTVRGRRFLLAKVTFTDWRGTGRATSFSADFRQEISPEFGVRRSAVATNVLSPAG